VYVLVETEGTTPVGLIQNSIFEQNTQEDWALVMSEGIGAFVDMSRNRFIENTGGLVSGGPMRNFVTLTDARKHNLSDFFLLQQNPR
jgi:hypothetical protein